MENEVSPAAARTMRIALLCSICNVLLGYDIGIMSVAHDFLKEDLDLTSFQDGFQVGILNAAAGVGGLLTGELADRYGRRGTMITAAVLLIAGPFMVALAKSFIQVVAGRIITGLGTGVAVICSPLLLAELTSPSKRGMFVGWTEVINNFGIFLGYLVGYCLCGMPASHGWRVMIGIGAVPPFAIMAATVVVPESPRWLMMRGRFADAEDAIKMVSEPEEVDNVMKSCEEAVSTEVAPWSEILCPGRFLRSVAVVGWGVPFLSQATGTESAVYFSPIIMEGAGITRAEHQYVFNVFVGVVKTSLLLIPMFLLDSYGRKPLLFNSVAGQVITALLLAAALAFASESSPIFVLVSLYLYIGTFSLGLSTLAFVIPTEAFPLKYRARGTGVSWFLNRITSSAVTISFMPAVSWIGSSGVYVFYSAVGLLGLFYVHHCVPETSNLSLEECEGLFSENHKAYGC